MGYQKLVTDSKCYGMEFLVLEADRILQDFINNCLAISGKVVCSFKRKIFTQYIKVGFIPGKRGSKTQSNYLSAC